MMLLVSGRFDSACGRFVHALTRLTRKAILFCIASLYGFADEIPPIDFITVVWGREYTDSYLRACLPMQLSPDNLGNFPSKSVRYRIFTTREDWERMQTHRHMQKLKEMVLVDFIEIPYCREDRHVFMTRYHQQAVRDAKARRAALVFLSPDCLIANRSFQTILRYATNGYRVIMTSALRTKKELVLPVIERALDEDRFYSYGVNPRELVKVCLPLMHPLSAIYCCDKTIWEHPEVLFWKLDEYNILAHQFHLHPIFVWPENYSNITNTVDYDFCSVACPGIEKWKIIQDSDEMVIFEFSSIDTFVKAGPITMMPCTPSTIATWAIHHAKPHQWHFLNHPIYIHSTDFQEAWQGKIGQIEAFVRGVVALSQRQNVSPQKIEKSRETRKSQSRKRRGPLQRGSLGAVQASYKVICENSLFEEE